MDKVVKVMLREEDIDTLDTQAKARSKPRMYLLREIIEKYLSGTQAGPSQVPAEVPEALTKALEETQRDREILQGRVNDLEKALTDKAKDLEWTRGQYAALTQAHNELIKKLPTAPAQITDGKTRPSWWKRITGGGTEVPTNPDQ